MKPVMIYGFVVSVIIIIISYISYIMFTQTKRASETYVTAPPSYNLIIVDGNGNMSSITVSPSLNPTPGTSNAVTPSLSSIPENSNIVTVDSNGNIGIVSPSSVYTSYMGPGQNVLYNLLTVDSNNNFSTISSKLFNPCQVYDDGTMNGVPLSTGGCRVNCSVSAWDNWDACPCNGGGKISRRRTVTVPPANGGTACPAVLTESQSCLNIEPCANDPECSFIRSDDDLRSSANILSNLTFKNACCEGGSCDCSNRSYIKCGKTSGGHYIKTSQYDYYLKAGPTAYAGSDIQKARSTMTLRNGENIFGPCGNCGPATNGASLDITSSDPKCKNANPPGTMKFNLPICVDALKAVDSNGETPPPNPKPENQACDRMLFGFCL